MFTAPAPHTRGLLSGCGGVEVRAWMWEGGADGSALGLPFDRCHGKTTRRENRQSAAREPRKQDNNPTCTLAAQCVVCSEEKARKLLYFFFFSRPFNSTGSPQDGHEEQ